MFVKMEFCIRILIQLPVMLEFKNFAYKCSLPITIEHFNIFKNFNCHYSIRFNEIFTFWEKWHWFWCILFLLFFLILIYIRSGASWSSRKLPVVGECLNDDSTTFSRFVVILVLYLGYLSDDGMTFPICIPILIPYVVYLTSESVFPS